MYLCHFSDKHLKQAKLTESLGVYIDPFLFGDVDGDFFLRNSNMNLYIPFPKTDYLKKFIGYNGAKLWNELPRF